jgi:hypothetical protein
MLYPKTWDLKRSKSLGIESQPSSTKKLGFQPKSSNPRPNPEFEGSRSSTKMHKAYILDPTRKSELKHPRIRGTSRARKSNENCSKKTRKSHEIQEGNRCMPWDPATCSSTSKLLAHLDPVSARRASGLGFVAQPSNPTVLCEPPQTPRADSGCEPLPFTGSCPLLRLAFLSTMLLALGPTGHRAPRDEPTCLSTPRRPCKA